MRAPRPVRTACFILFMTLLAGLLLPLHDQVYAAPAVNGVVSPSIPLLDLVAAGMGRSRTYKNDNQYLSEQTGLYDSQRNTLRTQFKNYVHAVLSGDPNAPKIAPMRDNQVAAYVIDANLIEARRESTLKFGEAVKKDARNTFNKALKNKFQDRIMATNMLQRVLGAFTFGLGGAQVLINALSGKLDQVPGIDIELSKLRTFTDELRTASGVFHGPVISDFADKLDNLAARLKSKADLTQGDLDEATKQISTLKTRLEGLAQSKDLPSTGSVLTTDMGAQLIGLSPGTAATEAILRLVAKKEGRSYEEIRALGTTYLAAGDKARCRAKAEAIQEALLELAKQQGQELVIKPPAALCDEINGAKLLSRKTPTPKSPSKNVTDPDNIEFTEDNCACGEFQVAKAEPWGNSSLSCTYEWTGPSGIKSTLSFMVARLFHLDDQAPDFKKNLGDIQYRLKDVHPPDVADVFLNDAYDYGMVITGPGGISPTNNQPIPMCGSGKGIYTESSNYLINTSLSSCDLGQDAAAYIDAMQRLADCAMASIDGKYP